MFIAESMVFDVGEAMANDFFLGFAGHAHTMDEMLLDAQKELELRRKNSPEEAQKLAGMILDKLERDISGSGYGLKDVKLLLLYSSYRGESTEKDTLICESILKSIENRFRKQASTQLRLIGHTTGGELENEDLMLKQTSGIGYNGLSLLALVTNLPIGVGRTWGLRTADEAGEQGKEMTRDAWVDFTQQTSSKKHLHIGKTLLALTQGSSVNNPGYAHFLAEGIANFMGSSREARIMNIIGGCSGDGMNAQLFHQFYGRLKEHTQFRVLNGEAVCALIPNLTETSVGLDPGTAPPIGGQHIFHFDTEKEPRFKYVKSIDTENPVTKYAEMIYENEVRLSREKSLPLPDKEQILGAFRAPKTLLIFNPTMYKYAFAFPFGNFSVNAPMRVVGEDIELMLPIRSYAPEMAGYVLMADYVKVQKGARRVYDTLREDRGFRRNDATILVSCINRRLVELTAGCRSGTEAEILKEGFSSTQAIGFLAYGELSFTHLIQEPYFHAFSCWGLTFHSRAARTPETVPEFETMETQKSNPGRVATGYPILDKLLYGGIPDNYAIALTAPPCEERDSLVMNFLRKGIGQGEVTFFLTVNPTIAQSLGDSDNFHFFVCNSQADSIIKDSPNVSKLKGVENLTAISISLSSAISKLDPSQKGPRRICIELLSDVLLQHHAVQTRRWLTSLITEVESAGFTTLAVMDPRIHPSEELYAILGLFDGEISLYEKQTGHGPEKYLKINKMSNTEYQESELPLRKSVLKRENDRPR